MLSLNKRVKCNYGTWILCTSLKRYKVGCDILKAYLHEIMPKNQSASWYDFFSSRKVRTCTRADRYPLPRPAQSIATCEKGWARAHVPTNTLADLCNLHTLYAWCHSAYQSPNVSAIGPADPEIWKRGAHVRTCRSIPLPTCEFYI